MLAETITIETDAYSCGGRRVAVLRCTGEPVSVDDLAAAVATLPAAVVAVVLALPETPASWLELVAAGNEATATARPVTDALKRVAGGRIVASVDRTRLFRAGLPMYLPRTHLARRLGELPGRCVSAGELIAADIAVRFVDDPGSAEW